VTSFKVTILFIRDGRDRPSRCPPRQLKSTFIYVAFITFVMSTHLCTLHMWPGLQGNSEM